MIRGLNFLGGVVTCIAEATASESLDLGDGVFYHGFELKEKPLGFFMDENGTYPAVYLNPICAPDGVYEVYDLKKSRVRIDIHVEESNESLDGIKQKIPGTLILSPPDYNRLAGPNERDLGELSRFYGIVDVLMMRKAEAFC